VAAEAASGLLVIEMNGRAGERLVQDEDVGCRWGDVCASVNRVAGVLEATLRVTEVFEDFVADDGSGSGGTTADDDRVMVE
jgi:hypothetical protein